MTRNGVIRSYAARLGWVPAFGELLDDPGAERGQVVWIAADHLPLHALPRLRDAPASAPADLRLTGGHAGRGTGDGNESSEDGVTAEHEGEHPLGTASSWQDWQRWVKDIDWCAASARAVAR